MTLDPIVSLAVAIAEAPGSFAFMLGSGVSRDAGVPTGSEVFWTAVGELYRLEMSVDKTPDQSSLANFLRETDRADLAYSGILELIAPDQATRRDYLAKNFEGIEPGRTHEQLADLAVAGLVKVFVTTNFDRLLEHALSARGIEPVVVTSAEDLARAPRREHAPTYVLKPHGDYLLQTIRNTPAELSAFDEPIARELREIFDRYGIVVLGYSGTDEGMAEALRSRQSNYGLYWVTRTTPLSEPARSIVEATAGRIIERQDAATFLADLERRLAVFREHPSGQTPVAVYDEMLALLGKDDEVGAREMLRTEQREFEREITELYRGRQGELPNADMALEVHDAMSPPVERRMASLLPLVVHGSDLLRDEISSLADFCSRTESPGGYTFWSDLPEVALWRLGYVLGAIALRERRFEQLRWLLEADRASATYRAEAEPLLSSVEGSAGNAIGESVMARVDDKTYFSPAFEVLMRDVVESGLVRERFPELVEGSDEPKRSLTHFDLLLNASLGLRDQRSAAHWTMYEAISEAYAGRLHADKTLQAGFAEALGIPPEDSVLEAVATALEKAHPLGQFASTGDVVSLIRNGSLR
jgi:SIR2-like domain